MFCDLEACFSLRISLIVGSIRYMVLKTAAQFDESRN